MGFKSSSWYRSKIIEIEEKLAEEHNLAGVSRHENGEDQLDLDKRLKELMDLKSYYEIEYNKALIREGDTSSVYNFIPRRMMGN